MLALTWLVPALPLAGFVVLALFGRRLPAAATPIVGVGSAGLGLLAALAVASGFFAGKSRAFTQTLWTWFDFGGLTSRVAFRVDGLSLAWVMVITFVGFLILLYSIEYMAGDPDFPRFFAYMDLFIASMLVLVLADDLILLYLGWEGVGLCSYLLIGFWYRDPANARAAIKAFLVTRIGDTAFAVGLFVLFVNFHTLSIQPLMAKLGTVWSVGAPGAILAAALLLGGAVGKSAQVPLQVWLPDAMAGPTPTSALIHAATMVTAGVYLIARTNALFALAPPVRTAIAVIGAVTLIIAASAALVQRDLKRVLAYSTISQIGYMFVALGVGAVSAAVFHFITHAFFKALLFLAAGVVIHALSEEHDMFLMGGLRRKLPVAFWTFLIGAASLAALPLVTAGFYSKELILFSSFASPAGSAWLWVIGLAGAVLTALYSVRMVILTFFGRMRTAPAHMPGALMLGPLVVLAVLSIFGGFVETPSYLGNVQLVGKLVTPAVTGAVPAPENALLQLALGLVAIVFTVGALIAAYYLFRGDRVFVEQFATTPAGARTRRFLLSGWGFDTIYDTLFVRPYVWLAYIDRDDVIDLVFRGIAAVTLASNRFLSSLQTGKLRNYAFAVVLGAAALLVVVMLQWF